MYAIIEANRGRGIGGRSADQHDGEWWSRRGWTPASDEAMTFDSAEEATACADEHCTREYEIIEVD